MSPGWFAYEPGEEHRGTDEDGPLDNVVLMAEEHGGPWWCDEGGLGDDYDDLRRWLGISRELYDAAMAWNADVHALTTNDERTAHRARGEQLARRLRAEVAPGVTVTYKP